MAGRILSAPGAWWSTANWRWSTPTDPQYLAMAYAPVMFGRSTSALHDVPLLVDATATPAGGGSTQLSYTFIWSHEDAGTGFVPFLEWGTWGRMTDIENAISFTVAADGSTSGASYLWGGEPATGFPDSQGALQEVDEPFTGQWDGHHPVLRDATGNNDFSVSGTTPFRFQLAPVAGPAPGQTRESVMDAHPSPTRSPARRSPAGTGTSPPIPARPSQATPGSTPPSTSTPRGRASPPWPSSSSCPETRPGTPATSTPAIRPTAPVTSAPWSSCPSAGRASTITGVRVQVYPPAATSSVSVQGLSVLALQQNWSLTTPAVPPPEVVAGSAVVPVALQLAAGSGPSSTVAPHKPVAAMLATVTDPLGHPLVGVPVTFTAGGPGLTFNGCHCASVTVLSRANGVASSGRATATSITGPVVVRASTADAATPPVVSTVTVGGPSGS